MSKLLLIGLTAAMLVGCKVAPPDNWETDQVMRRQLFRECMQLLPAGPEKTVYNDWDDVVEECGIQAYRQALYCTNCTAEQRGER